MKKQIIKWYKQIKNWLIKTENESFYLGKGKNDQTYYIYYGEQTPIIKNETITSAYSKCSVVGTLIPKIADGLVKDSEIIEITIKRKKL